MNGRVYDPFMALFMSPDPYVQSPSDWLNYNRYSYCLNNPFKYTDPSGEIAVVDDILIGMAIAAAIYQAGATAGLHGFSTKDFLQTVVIGGVSAAATRGIGEIFGGVGSMADGTFSVMRELGRATAHGIVQGGLSVAGGGSFGSGFVSGAFSSMAGALAAGSGVKFIQTGFGHAMIASATGGITSVIAGGDFFQGAVSGLFVSLFNQGEKHGAQGGGGEASLLVLGWEGALLEPTPIGEAVMAVATGAAVLYYGPDIVDKMHKEIAGIKQRAAGPMGTQYALTAKTSGYYPNVRSGTTYLKAGEVWKYGETTSSDRYSAKYLRTMGLNFTPQFFGNQMEIKIQEKVMIYSYFFGNGSLPPGNSIFR